MYWSYSYLIKYKSTKLKEIGSYIILQEIYIILFYSKRFRYSLGV